MKILKACLVLFVSAAFLIGCSGGSREVESCDDCNQGTTWKTNEYCVMGEGTQLYCANPCIGHIDCEWDQWCVPLPDQGTPYDDRTGRIRWVCMPYEYYAGKKKVRLVTECSACEADETCLEDTRNSAKYCSEACGTDSECLSGCCAETEQGSHYCAPYHYCGSVDEIDDCGDCSGTACINPEGDNLMCAVPCTSSDSCPFGELCLPWEDEAAGDGSIAWACVPTSYYEGKGKVRRMGGDCTAAPYECEASETCLYDDSVDPYIYFCSDTCTGASGCVTGCCYDLGDTDYCAPADYCE